MTNELVESLRVFFANPDQSLDLKKLGFNKPCLGYYSLDIVGDVIPNFRYNNRVGRAESIDQGVWYNHNSGKEHIWSAPLKSQVFEWFRDNYDIHYSIDRECSQHDRKWGYNWSLYNWTGLIPEEYLTSHPNAPAGEWVYEKYEEAEYALIDKLIQIVKRNEK